MQLQWVISLGTAILGALALFSIGFWIVGLVEGMRHDRQQTLHQSMTSLLELRGFYTSTIVLSTPFLALMSFRLTNTQPDAGQEETILVATFILFGICGILWAFTLYLRLRAKRPSYVYLLPEAADQVRIQGCIYGILLMAQTYPKIIQDREWLDLFARSIEVGSRIDALPVLKSTGYQLTNDFLVYCNLAAEGFTTGYYRCAEQCNANPDRLEELQAQVQAFPESQEAKNFLQQAAIEMLGEEEA